jgi:hypothetical protein
MLVELEKIAKFPWSKVLAQVQTPFGRTAVRWWRTGPAAGQCHVEWTRDARYFRRHFAGALCPDVRENQRHFWITAGPGDGVSNGTKLLSVEAGHDHCRPAGTRICREQCM